jgi:hypothetical protein
MPAQQDAQLLEDAEAERRLRERGLPPGRRLDRGRVNRWNLEIGQSRAGREVFWHGFLALEL